MAERKLEVRILGDSRSLERAFGRSSASARKFDRQMGSVGRATAGLAKGFAAAAAGIGVLAVVGAREMSEQAKVSAQTATVLRNVGKQAGLTTKQVEGLASALQASTGAADDEVQAASNVILRFGLITKTGKAAEGQLREMTATALDLSVATGKDLSASAQALGRALADPTKASGALRRAGIMLTSAQKDQIKAMAEGGNVAGAQARVLDLVQSRVKGSAEAFGNTLPGQVERAKRSFEDLAENTLAALAPALAKLAPVLVKAIQGIAPVIARVGTVIADLANELINNPAFREFAATLRDLAVRGVEALASAFRTLAPVVIAVLAPIAGLAAALTRSRVAMTVLTAAVAAFVALKATAYVTGLVASFRALAITQSAASGMRALTTATAALAFGFRGVSAQAVGLAPGLTAAAGGVTRVGVAANAAKGIVPGLGRALSGALGGPVGIAVTATAALATVIGGDLIRSFTSSKDPAQRYADAMRDAADGTKAAKDSLEGLADALLGGADAQDRTREATAGRVKAERELRTLEASGIRSGPQYEAAVKNVATARREEARSTLAARDATDLMQQKQNEARGTVAGLVQSLGTARSNAMAGAQAITGFGLSSGQARGQYAQFSAVANGKIMASGELKKFQDQATTMAGVFRNTGTPAALKIADALDNVGKARTPDGVSKWAGILVGLLGGSKREVEAAKKAMNADLGKVGNVRPSGTFFSSLAADISSAMSGLESLARRIADVARKRAKGGRENAREMAAGFGPNAMSFFYSQRQAAAGAASGLSGMAREGFLRRDPEAQRINQRRKARQKDLNELQQRELQARVQSAQTADERLRAEIDLAEFLDALAWESVETAADAEAQKIDDLASQFGRGVISAETFQAELSKLIGGDTGASNGQQFGERWIAAFELALGDGSALRTIINNAMGGQTGAQPIEGPSPEDTPEPEPVWDLKKWTSEYKKYSTQLINKNPGWFGKGNRITPAGGRRMAELLRAWTALHPMPRAALGGITRGLTIAGEAGAEAIIPLTGTRGRDYMARVMDQVGGRGATVVVNVAGNEFSAEEFARKIGPELRRQIALTGSY
jgi:hypothetical protein